MTLKELCRELGLSPATVQTWKRTQANWAKKGIYLERERIKKGVWEYTITRKEVEEDDE